MKQTILKLTLAFFLGNLLLISCRKPEDLVKPVPQPQTPPPVLSQSFQLTIDSLPGEPVAPVSNIFVLVNLVNAQNEPVLTNRKLPLSFNGKFRTPELELPSGTYRVSQLLIVNGDNQIRFVTPIANSAKAAMVSKPLPVSFILPQPAVLNVAIEVAKVLATDAPESFGYPAGLFNQLPNTPPGNENSFFKIKMKLVVQVGDIQYDSIPGTVLYSTWDENQQVTGKYFTLAPGTNEIILSRAATKHHFRVNKWGVVFELTLLKNEIQDGSLYTLAGAKQAKKLKTELVYKLVGGTYVPETKTSFNYQSDGKLSSIDYYLPKADKSPYLAMRNLFQYSNGRVERINRFDENNQQSGYTSFSYNNTGKIDGVTESANNTRTIAAVDYHYSKATGLTEVNFDFSYSHTSNGMRYYQRHQQGNLVSDNSVTDNHNTETGRYEYDNNINPHAHLGWPNLFLSNDSKNNLLRQQKTYYGNYPVAVAYEFIYKYDAEGYPVELTRHYKSYMTNQFLYTTKTVFSY